MKDLAALLTQTEEYEQLHAEWIAAGVQLQAKREAVIAFGKSLGYFAGRMNADLPKVPNLKVPDEPAPAEPDLLTGLALVGERGIEHLIVPAASIITLSAEAKEAAPEGQPSVPPQDEAVLIIQNLDDFDKLSCGEMSDEQLCLGHMNIVARFDEQVSAHGIQGADEWIKQRLSQFNTQIDFLGITPRDLGAIAFRLNCNGNSKPFKPGTPEAKQWTDGWLEEQDKYSSRGAAGEASKAA